MPESGVNGIVADALAALVSNAWLRLEMPSDHGGAA